jgi:hypothetical protein
LLLMMCVRAIGWLAAATDGHQIGSAGRKQPARLNTTKSNSLNNSALARTPGERWPSRLVATAAEDRG